MASWSELPAERAYLLGREDALAELADRERSGEDVSVRGRELNEILNRMAAIEPLPHLGEGRGLAERDGDSSPRPYDQETDGGPQVRRLVAPLGTQEREDTVRRELPDRGPQPQS